MRNYADNVIAGIEMAENEREYLERRISLLIGTATRLLDVLDTEIESDEDKLRRPVSTNADMISASRLQSGISPQTRASDHPQTTADPAPAPIARASVVAPAGSFGGS